MELLYSLSRLRLQSYFHVTHDVVTWKPRVEFRFVVADVVSLCSTALVAVRLIGRVGPSSGKFYPFLSGMLIGLLLSESVKGMLREFRSPPRNDGRPAGERELTLRGQTTQSRRASVG